MYPNGSPYSRIYIKLIDRNLAIHVGIHKSFMISTIKEWIKRHEQENQEIKTRCLKNAALDRSKLVNLKFQHNLTQQDTSGN